LGGERTSKCGGLEKFLTKPGGGLKMFALGGVWALSVLSCMVRGISFSKSRFLSTI
jgi:hypothetical protein